MWLCDLEKAVRELRDLCPNYVFTKVAPAGTGIVFYTTHFSRVFWSEGCQIIEHYDNGEIKILKNFSQTY
jgi:hypothetical protein